MARRLTVWNPWAMVPDDPFDFEPFRTIDSEGVSMDMYEEGDNVVVELRAPGFDKEDVKIQVESNMITISGVTKKEAEENSGRKYYRKEIRSMSFSRTAELPASVKAEDSKALFKNGMLTITLPKKEEAKPKTISVDVE